MDQITLEKIFRKLSDKYGVLPEELRKIIKILINTTLKFRDMLVEQKESPLSLEETQKALDIFLEVLKKGKVTVKAPKRVMTLVTLWLEQIKLHIAH